MIKGGSICFRLNYSFDFVGLLAFAALGIELVDLFLPGHGCTGGTGGQFVIRFLVQFTVGKGGHGFVFILDHRAGGLGVVVCSAVGVVVQGQVIRRIAELPVQVIPDNHLGIGLA